MGDTVSPLTGLEVLELRAAILRDADLNVAVVGYRNALAENKRLKELIDDYRHTHNHYAETECQCELCRAALKGGGDELPPG